MNLRFGFPFAAENVAKLNTYITKKPHSPQTFDLWNGCLWHKVFTYPGYLSHNAVKDVEIIIEVLYYDVHVGFGIALPWYIVTSKDSNSVFFGKIVSITV